MCLLSGEHGRRRVPRTLTLALPLLVAAGAGCAHAHPATPVTGAETRAPAAGPPVLPAAQIPPEVLALHRDAILVDGHSDTAQRLLDERIDFGTRLADGMMDLPRLKEGGVDAQFFAAWIGPDLPEGRAFARTDSLLDAVVQLTRSNPEIELARTAADVRAIAGRGHVAALLAIENGQAIENDLDKLRYFARKGVRYMTLTWMNSNDWADGSGGELLHYGLTDFGREVVREMERLGVLVDVSHVADATFWDVLEIATKPVIASHSSTDALQEHHRNLNDQQLRAIARNGGVVGINFYPAYIDPAYAQAADSVAKAIEFRLDSISAVHAADPAAAAAARDSLRKRALGSIPRPPLSRVVDHIVHVVQVAGIDHVGLGSDFDGIGSTPVGLEDASRFPYLTWELKKRGFSDEDVKKILGENFLRVLAAAETPAGP
jgi:membrane dipeptidase